MTSQCSKSQPSMVIVSSTSSVGLPHTGSSRLGGEAVVVQNRRSGLAEWGTSWLRSAMKKRWREEILKNEVEEEEERGYEERESELRRREDEVRLRADTNAIAD